MNPRPRNQTIMYRRSQKAVIQRMWMILVFLVSASICVSAQESSPPEVLPPGQVGVNYEYQLQASGGAGELTWRKVDGSLPENVTLDSSGKLKGMPTIARAEPYVFTVEVADSSPTPQKFQL